AGGAHDELEAVTEEAAVGEPLEARGLELEAGVARDGSRLVLEATERALERTEIAAVEADPDRRDAVDARRGHQQAERRGHAGRWRADHAAQPPLLRDVAARGGGGSSRA